LNERREAFKFVATLTKKGQVGVHSNLEIEVVELHQAGQGQHFYKVLDLQETFPHPSYAEGDLELYGMLVARIPR